MKKLQKHFFILFEITWKKINNSVSQAIYGSGKVNKSFKFYI